MAELYNYEKLGLLYLGRQMLLAGPSGAGQPLLYKNSDMTTHGVMIGMTGSGKTGLGVALIEEAIMDGVPSLIIDPKGDMANLLLTFPRLAPEDFEPWVDPAEAARKEMSVAEYAARTARTWREGLEAWGQGPERIAALREKTDMAVYTPGSEAGLPLSVLAGFEAPAPDVLTDTDTLNSLVSSTATSLLSLVDISGDPLQSREHILLSSLLLHFWRLGRDLSLETLIGQVAAPPFDRVGVFPLDTFYPQAQRLELAMRLNNILASPSFAAWTRGEPLDIQRLLYTEEGRPRTSIFSIAHLGDSERMFFVTTLLNRVIGWMRRQPGSSSLKALLYMDEIFGYFPPSANPPAKKPMLLLLKQARAFGVGVVLATQNPVDLDYKGLANIGSWFIGRLQTRQDQDRVVQGVAGASGGRLDEAAVRKLLASMQGRQFLLQSSHLDGPVLFETRWVMSYLKGPVTSEDIKRLMAKRRSGESGAAPAPAEPAQPLAREPLRTTRTIMSLDLEQLYFLHNVIRDEVVFQPWLSAYASVRFYNAKRNIDEVREICLRLPADEDLGRAAWQDGQECPFSLDECLREPPAGASFLQLPAILQDAAFSKEAGRAFSEYLYQHQRLELLMVKELKFESLPGESEGDFRVRLGDYLRRKKDEAVEALRKRYRTRQERLERRMETALDRLDREEAQVRAQTTDSIISFGVAVVGAFFGRKAMSRGNIGRAATSLRGVGRVAREKEDVRRAEEDVADLQRQLAELAAELESEAAALAAGFAVDNYEIETFAIKPRRSDIFAERLALVWEMAL